MFFLCTIIVPMDCYRIWTLASNDVFTSFV